MAVKTRINISDEKKKKGGTIKSGLTFGSQVKQEANKSNTDLATAAQQVIKENEERLRQQQIRREQEAKEQQERINKAKENISKGYLTLGASVIGHDQRPIGSTYEDLASQIKNINPLDFVQNREKYQNILDTAINFQPRLEREYNEGKISKDILDTLTSSKYFNSPYRNLDVATTPLAELENLQKAQDNASSVLDNLSNVERENFYNSLKGLDTRQIANQFELLGARDDNLIQRIGNTFSNIGKDFVYNVANTGRVATEIVKDITGDTSDSVIDQQLDRFKEQADLDLQKAIEGADPVTGTLLQASAGVGQFAILTALTGGNAGMALKISTGLSGSGAFVEAEREGYDFTTSALYGLAIGATNYLVENLPFGNIEKILTGKGNGLKYIIASTASQAFSEGAEEGVQYFAEQAVNRLVLDKDFDFNGQDLMMNMFLGALGGGMMGGVSSSIRSVVNQKQYNYTKQNVELLYEYLNNNDVSPEERSIFEQVIRSAESAMQEYQNRSVIGDAVQFQSDQIPNLTYNQIMDAMNRIDSVDAKTNVAAQDLLYNSQRMLSARGINMDAVSFANLDQDTKQQVVNIQDVANELGANVKFDTNTDEAGHYDPQTGEILINPLSKNGSLSIFMHELTHTVEGSQYYQTLSDLLTETYGDDVNTAKNNLREYYAQNGEKLSDEGVDQEFVAVQAQEDLADENFVKRLVNYNSSLAYRLYEGIRNLTRSSNQASQIEYNFLKAFRDVDPTTLKNRISNSKIANYFFGENTQQKTQTQYFLDDNNQEIQADLQNNRNEVLSMEPVVEINNSYLAVKDGTPVVEKLIDYFERNYGSKTYVDGLGEVLLDKRGIKDDISHRNSKLKFSAYEGIVPTLQNGLITDIRNKYENRAEDRMIISAPVRIDGVDYIENVIIRQFGGRNSDKINRLYVHDVSVIQKNGNNLLFTDPGLGIQGNRATDTAYSYNISNNGQNVKNSLDLTNEDLRNPDLLAIHNLSADNLRKALNLGGFAMPSIAVTKDSIDHNGFGDISLVFDKSSIDPEANTKNKVYSRDAWTPMFPRIEYDINEDRAYDLYKEMIDLSKKYDIGKSINFEQSNLSDRLSRDHMDRIIDDPLMKLNYLEEKGKEIGQFPRHEIDLSNYTDIINNLSRSELETLAQGYNETSPEADDLARRIANIRKEIYEQRSADLSDDAPLRHKRILERNIKQYTDPDIQTLRSIEQDAYNALNNIKTNESGGVVNEQATNAYLDSLLGDDYRAWAQEKINSLIDGQGFLNGTEFYTASGNKRPFSKTHTPYTLDNVVDYMASQNDTAGGGFGSDLGNLLAANSKRYNSIKDIIDDEGRLSARSDAIYDELKQNYDNVKDDIVKNWKYYNQTGLWNAYNDFSDVSSKIAKGDLDPARIQREFKKNDYDITLEQAQKFADLLEEGDRLTTGYFEAKPQRAVNFSEVRQAYVPEGTDPDIIEQLEAYGIEVIPYNEGQRNASISNNASRYKFSLDLNNDDLKLPKDETKRRTDFKNKLIDYFGVHEQYKNDPEFLQAIDNVMNKSYDGTLEQSDIDVLKQETWDRMYEDAPEYAQTKELYKDIRKQIKETKIRVDSIFPSDFERGGLSKGWWNDFRKKNFGTFTFSNSKGSDIDEVYDDLARDYSALFPDVGEAPQNKLEQIAKVFKDFENQKTLVHVSNLGFGDEAMREMDDYLSEIMDFSNMRRKEKFTQKVNEEEGTDLSVSDIDDLLNQKASLKTLKAIDKSRKEFVVNMREWLPDYDILADKYKDFSYGNFNDALFETFTGGDIKPETKARLMDDIKKKIPEPQASQHIEDFLTEAINLFGTDAVYRSNKRYMDSVASRTNKTLSNYAGLEDGIYDERFNQVDSVKKAEKEIKEEIKNYKTSISDVIEDTVRMGKDFGSEWRTLEQNLDVLANGNIDLRQDLRNTFELPRQEAQAKMVNRQHEAQNTINELLELGIREGTKESQATQWLMEGHKEDGTKYTLDDLKKDFDYDLKGQKAYEAIQKSADILRKAYDKTFNEINSQRRSIYGEIETDYLLKAEELRNEIDTLVNLRDNLGKQLKSNPTPEKQAGYTKAKEDIKKLKKQMDAILDKANTDDLTRRQILPYRQNYAHHIKKKDSFVSRLFKALTSKRQVPTELSGLSQDTKPRSMFSSIFKPQGNNYDADAVAGFADYAKETSKIVAYDPLIAKYRDIANEIRSEATGRQMSKFVNYLSNYTNSLAGKTDNLDRAIRDRFGEKGLNTIKTLNQRVRANALLGNVRTAVTQIFNIPNGIGVLSQKGGVGTMSDVAKGSFEFLTNMFSDTAPHNQSPFLNARFFDFETGKTGIGKTINDFTSAMLTKGDEVATKMIWYSAYNQAQRMGVDDAITYADDITRRSVAGRSIGEIPLALQSNIMNLIIPFQVETNNALNTLKGLARDKAISSVLAILIADWLFNNLSEELYGDRILFDPIDVIQSGIEDQDSAQDITTRMAGELISQIPGSNYLISLFGLDEYQTEKLFGDSDPTWYGLGNIGLQSIGDIAYNLWTGKPEDAISDLVANYLMPGGGRQLQRTIEGAQVMGGLPQLVTRTDEEGNKTKEWVKEPIYYTGSGKIGFVTDPTDPIDYATALLFGKWATDEGREYIESGFKTASQTETKLFDNLNEGNATEAFSIAEQTFEAKKEYSTREEFLGYLDSAPYSNKDKNEILDTYYGENKIVSNLNDFADQYGLDEDEMYQIKSYGLNQKGVLDSSGKNISNTKALNYRKQLTEMGLYDSLAKYIEQSGVAPADVGLTKTVYGMSDAEFESKYNYYFNSDGTAKTGTQTSGSSRSSYRSGSRSYKVKDAYGVSEDDYNKAIGSIENIYNKIQSKIYSNANSFFDIEIPDIKELKIDISNELKLDTDVKDLFKKYSSSMFDDLIDSYFEDHPYSNLFEGL